MDTIIQQPLLPGMPEAIDIPVPVDEEKRKPASVTSTLISAWIPNDVYEVLKRRASRHPGGISGYVRARLTYDLAEITTQKLNRRCRHERLRPAVQDYKR